VLLAAITASFPANVTKAQTDADFSAFCREKFPGSAYQRLDQSWGAQHVCNQGGTPQGIDIAEACRLTTGNTGHRVTGTRVICDGVVGGPGPDRAGNAGPVDLAAYCRTEFPNSAYEKRFEPTGIKHYCRRPGATGGFTLQGIDLAAACRTQRNADSFLKAGNEVVCFNTGGDDRRQAGGSGGGGGGNPPAQPPEKDQQGASPKITQADITRLLNRDFPALEQNDIIDAGGTGELSGKGVKFASLQDCGNGDPKFMLLGLGSIQKSRADPAGLNGRGWDLMGVSMPCPGLTDGLKVSFDAVCGKSEGQTVMVRSSGLPICWRKGGQASLARQSESDLDGHFGLKGATLNQVCYTAFETLGKGKFDPKILVPLIKYELKELDVECYYIKRDRLFRILGLNGGKPQGSADLRSLSNDALAAEIKAARAAVAELDRQLQATRQNAVYTGRDRAAIDREIKAKYDREVRETEARKLQLDIERGKERDRKQIASDCSSADSCEKMELDEKYERLKARLDEALRDYRGNLEDDMILSHGDKGSRALIKVLKPERSALKERLDKLQAEQRRRYRVADEQQRNAPSPFPDAEDDEPLFPDGETEEGSDR
jgi:hypothetical protein